MAREANIRGYWPAVIDKIREFKVIATAQDPELTELWQAIEDVANDQYIESATPSGVKRLEDILRIVPRATETIEDRKFQILARWNEQLPYTDRSLRERLTTLCGPDGFTMAVDTMGYEIRVRIELVVKNQFDAVGALLEDIVPMNMIIDLDLRYNQHRTLAQFTHAELGAYTHKQLRDEVIT